MKTHVPITEARNPETLGIDMSSPLEIVTLINGADARVAEAVRDELANIAAAVETIVQRLQQGGRLFYLGAGTSGRLGVLDASEMPPTFSTSPELVQAFIAGGDVALRHSVEAAEDDDAAGAQVVNDAGVNAADAVVGISASGAAPWVLGAIAEAEQRGAATIALTCNPDSPLTRRCHIAIVPFVGPEVIAGSSRMKAGTAQKMVLNMLSTATMIRLGKVYENLMVDVRPTNAKLRRRAVQMLQQATETDEASAQAVLQATDYRVKAALVMILANVDAQEALRRLDAADGFVRRAI